MNRFKSLKSQVAVAVTFLALGLAGIFIQADQAGAQNGPKHEPTTHPVDIVSPLPLPVTVDGTVTGTVAATQSGEWNVGIPAVVSVKNIDEKGRNLAQPATRFELSQAFRFIANLLFVRIELLDPPF